ncbi:MAG: FHA domain-containing protein [Chloroflexota bacterium]
MTQQIITHRFQIRGPQLSFTFTASEGKTAIGRHSDNNLVFTHPLVSRSHAQLICTADSCTLIDLGSTHGTFVNQERLEANAPLRLVAGMVVEIGAFRMVYDPEVTVVDEPEKPDIPEVAAAVEEPETAVAETPPPPLPTAPVAPAARTPTGNNFPRTDTDYVDTVPFTPSPPPPGFGRPRHPHHHRQHRRPTAISTCLALPCREPLPAILARHLLGQENTFIPRFLALLESFSRPRMEHAINFYLFLDPRTRTFPFCPGGKLV